MAHAHPDNGATVYVDDLGGGGTFGVTVPEDTFTPDGFETTVKFVGPGLLMERIDLDV